MYQYYGNFLISSDKTKVFTFYLSAFYRFSQHYNYIKKETKLLT